MSGSASKRRLRKVTERSLERRRRGQTWHTGFNPRIENPLSKNQQIPVQGSLARLSVEELGEGGRFVPRRFIRAQDHGDVLLYRL